MDELAVVACAASTGIFTACEHDPDKQLSLKMFYEACNSQGETVSVTNATCMGALDDGHHDTTTRCKARMPE